MADTRRVTQLTQTLRFDLTNAFARYLELLANLFQRPGVTINQSETQFENLPFAFGQTAEDILQLALQQAVARHVHRVLSLLVFDEVAEVRFVAIAHR